MNSDNIAGKYNKIGLWQLYLMYSNNSSFENPVFWAQFGKPYM